RRVAARRNQRGTAGERRRVAPSPRACGHVPRPALAASALPPAATGAAGVSRDAGALPEKMLAIHEDLQDAGIEHAFGGALALAWCTQQARGTIDLDVNVFVGPERTDEALAGLPSEVVATSKDRALLAREGQARLWWGTTPIDIFLNTTDFHDQ